MQEGKKRKMLKNPATKEDKKRKVHQKHLLYLKLSYLLQFT